MRRGLLSLSAAAAGAFCALTRKRVTDWDSHNRSFDMRLLNLLRSRLTSSTNPLPANQIYSTIVNPCRLIDEFTCTKTTKRMSQLRTSLGFLRRHNVLLHSLLFYAKETQTWNVTPGFGRLALFGESILRHEVRCRTLRLFPTIDSVTFAELTSLLLSEDAFCDMFDNLMMKSLVGMKPEGKNYTAMTKQERSNMLCAVVAEMNWFAARTKATDRTHNNALFPPSDALILHVLCCHLLESIPAELVYSHVEPRVRRIKEVWINEPMSLPSQLHLKPRTIGALSLSAQAAPMSAGEQRRKAEAQAAAICSSPLSPEPVIGAVLSRMQPRWNFRRFEERRYQILKTDKYCGDRFPSLCTSKAAPGPPPPPPPTSVTDERRRELVAPAFGNA